MSTALQTTQNAEKAVEYIPFGSQDKIKLTLSIVKNLVSTKTRSGQTCTDRDAMKFIMLCQAQRLNPFAGDAYLVGYDGKDGPQFSLITAHQAFLKRAEVSKEFDGMESGVILRHNETGEESELPGDFYDGENYQLLGGWARVHHKGRKFPTFRRIALDRFNTGRSQWEKDPAGMIVKCAEADALRSTFPTMLGGLYIQGESAPMEVQSSLVLNDEPKAKIVQLTNTEPTQPTEPVDKPAAISPQDALQGILEGAGHKINELQAWAIQKNILPDCAPYSQWSEVPADVAKRLAGAGKSGMLKSIAEMKGGAM